MEIGNSKIDLHSIQPFSAKPIKKIPKFVFENCNQVTCNDYADQYLSALRTKTQKITKTQLEEWGKDKEAGWFTQKAEEMDWVYGLDALEKEFFDKEGSSIDQLFEVGTILKYNRLFSRLVGESGEFRKRDIRWAKKDTTAEEVMVIAGAEKSFAQQIGPTWFTLLSNPGENRKLFETPKQVVKQGLELVKAHPQAFDFSTSSAKTQKYMRENLSKLNTNIVDDWLKEQGRTDNILDLFQWINQRFHYFPPHQMVEEELSKMEKEISSRPDMHAIEKAARIWLSIVEIHISHEANKRTGKALASVILLNAGYLPPKIDKKDTQEYLDKLKAGFYSSEGREAFIQYVAQKIIETQQEASAKGLKVTN